MKRGIPLSFTFFGLLTRSNIFYFHLPVIPFLPFWIIYFSPLPPNEEIMKLWHLGSTTSPVSSPQRDTQFFLLQERQNLMYNYDTEWSQPKFSQLHPPAAEQPPFWSHSGIPVFLFLLHSRAKAVTCHNATCRLAESGLPLCQRHAVLCHLGSSGLTPNSQPIYFRINGFVKQRLFVAYLVHVY